jgi:hypothetical protein
MAFEDLPPMARRRSARWFHELADELSEVDGSAVVWLSDEPGSFARPVVLPRQRRPEDGYRGLRY